MLLGRENLARFDNSLWMAVLQSLSAYQMYRQKVKRRIVGPDVIAYLLKDTQFPRAIAFSSREIGAALAMLPRSGEPIKKLGDLRRMLSLRRLGELSIADLHGWIDDAQLKLNELHALVAATWFRPSSTTAPGQAAVAAQSQSQSQSQSQPEQAPSQSQSQGAKTDEEAPALAAHS
jgi:uncharacterized alpha-E superfamily protein